MCLGLVMLVLLAQVSPKYLRMFAPWIYAIGILLLVIVAVIGDIGKGAQRWLDLGVAALPAIGNHETRRADGRARGSCTSARCRQTSSWCGTRADDPVSRRAHRRAAGPRHCAPHRCVGRVRRAARGPAPARHHRRDGTPAGARLGGLGHAARLPAQARADVSRPESDPLGAVITSSSRRSRSVRAACSARAG